MSRPFKKIDQLSHLPPIQKAVRIVRENLQVGQRFPDLELADHDGNLRKLSDLAGGDPLFLYFFRG